MMTLGEQAAYTNHHLGVQHLPYQNVKKNYGSEIMKDINFVKDNSNKTDEYIDAEIICDNEDPNDLARIAHDIVGHADDWDTENLDVGSTEYYDLCKFLLIVYYPKLDSEDSGEVLRIIRNEY